MSGKFFKRPKTLFTKSPKPIDDEKDLPLSKIKDISKTDHPNKEDTEENISTLNEKHKIQLKNAIADVAVHLWRIKRRMTDEKGEPIEETRRHFRHIQAAFDDLKSAEIEIKDFEGQLIPESGVLSMRVLAYQPTAGITSDQVIETVKPAVYLNGETIRYGEVIIGIPENEGDFV